MMRELQEPNKYELLCSVASVKCSRYEPERVEESVKRAVDYLGGIIAFVKPNSSVLVKPNLLMSKGPEAAITTHPQVIRAVIRLLKSIHCRIFVGDGPSVWGKYIQDVDTVYKMTGVEEVCRQEGVTLVKFDARRWRGKFPLTTWVDSCDHIVSVPKFKTHELTVLTGAVKNLFGLISGTFKTELHKMYYQRHEFARILIDIYQTVRPSLTIVDGVTALEGDGPAARGMVRELGVILAGAECIAVDTVMAMVMGIDPLAVPTIAEARRQGFGFSHRSDIRFFGANVDELNTRPFVLPSSLSKREAPEWLIRLAARFIRYIPVVDHHKCTRCHACVDACPMKIISEKHGKIHISYARCIACFCCLEACPAAAIFVRKSVLAKLIGL